MSGWPKQLLADLILDIKDGGTPSRANSSYFGGGIAWCVVKDIRPEIRRTAEQLTEAGLANCSAKLWPIGSVIISLGATIGEIGIAKIPVATKQGLAGIVPHPERITSEFLAYALREQVGIIRGMGRGTTIKEVRPRRLAEELMIAAPSLEEQKRTVAILDAAFAAIDTAMTNAEKNSTNAQELFESYLEASFRSLAGASPTRPIGQIAAIKGGKRVPKGYKLQEEPTSYPYLTVGDFSDEGSIDPTSVRYVSEEVHTQIKRYVIRSADLYVSIAGTIGRTGIIPDELDGAQLTENACRLVFGAEVSNRYVYYFTKSPSFKAQAIEQTRTTAQPKLALSRLEQIRLPVPPLDVQKVCIEKFEAIAEEVQSLTKTYRQRLEHLSALKQSLLHRAFSGQPIGAQLLAA